MAKKKKKIEKIEGEKGVEIFKEEKQGRFIITTSEPRGAAAGKRSRILQTHDLPAELPGYHYPIKKERS